MKKILFLITLSLISINADADITKCIQHDSFKGMLHPFETTDDPDINRIRCFEKFHGSAEAQQKEASEHDVPYPIPVPKDHLVDSPECWTAVKENLNGNEPPGM